jgi:hypothetical protein
MRFGPSLKGDRNVIWKGKLVHIWVHQSTIFKAKDCPRQAVANKVVAMRLAYQSK